MVPGLGARRAVGLLSRFQSPVSIFRASARDLEDFGLSASLAQSIASGCSFDEAVTQQEKLRQTGTDLIPIYDARYPAALKHIFDPPAVLYARGRVELLQTISLAVVGTRRPSPYGSAVADKLSTGLAAAGLTITSGLARGIDTSAHRAALEAGGNTIAVFGSGIDHVYPSENRRLAEDIGNRGLLLTEFPMGTPGYPQNFPVRNRIISGLSVGVLLIEGAQYSGSAITARLAMEQGREVFAVPGNITQKTSWGPNLLIKQGAKLVQDAMDILNDLTPEIRRGISAQRSLFGEDASAEMAVVTDELNPLLSGPMAAVAREVMAVIKTDDPLLLDQIVDRVEMFSSSEIIAVLFELELAGKVRQLPGRRFLKTW